MRMTRSLAVVLLLIVASACSDDEGDRDGTGGGTSIPAAPSEAASIIAESMLATAASDPNALQFTAEEASCVAARIVAEISPDRLVELGLDTADGTAPTISEPPLTTEEADGVFAAYRDCMDLAAKLATFFRSDPGMADIADCAAASYAESGVLREALFSAEFDPELNSRIDAAIADAVAAC